MFRKILAPLDGSPLAERCLPYVEAMAQKFGAEVVLGWVIQLRTYTVSEFEPIHYGVAPLLDTTAEKEAARSYLRRLETQLQMRNIRTSQRIVESHSIADAIVAMAAEEGVDVIVKTTYARLGPSRWLHGNVAALVLQRAPCPIFLVRISDDEVDAVTAAS